MSILSLRLPDSLHKKIKEFSREEGISINQFITSAISEKVSVFATLDYLEKRAKRADNKKFKEALSKIPDIEPPEYDKI